MCKLSCATHEANISPARIEPHFDLYVTFQSALFNPLTQINDFARSRKNFASIVLKDRSLYLRVFTHVIGDMDFHSSC